MKKTVKFLTLLLALITAVTLFAGCKEETDNKSVKGVSLNLTEWTFNDYDTKMQLVATVQPADAANTNVIWSSSDPAVAAVDGNNKVYPVGNGTAVITATTEDGGFTATCTITVDVTEIVFDPTVKVTGVILNYDEYSLKGTGSTLQLEATVTPFGATEKSVIWSTSDASVATVDASGLVTPHKKGTVIISATTVDGGFSASCQITIASSNQSVTEPTTYEVIVKPADIDKDGFFVNDELIATNHGKSIDAVAWIYLPGTNINIPVMQQVRDKSNYLVDGEYTDNWYLTHDTTGKYAKWGSAYMNNSTIGASGYIYNQNTVIYGHAGGKYIFDQLEDVTRTSNWFKKESNRYVYLNTLKEETVWQVFACYYTDSDKHYYIESDWNISEADQKAKLSKLTTQQKVELIGDKYKMMEFIHDDNAFAEYMNDWRNRLLETYSDSSTSFSNEANRALKTRSYGVSVQPGDKVLTLSTCADASGPVRYVICAKLIKSRPRTN